MKFKLKEGTKRKICFSIAAMVFLMGVWGILNRKDPIEKNIGNVYISDGVEETAIKGYKAEINRGGKVYEYKYPDIRDEADRLCTINASPENSENMKISYSKEHYSSAEYSIYDSDFNLLSENQPSLNIPAETEKIYFISVSVLWGSENENVRMLYYFSVKT